MKVLLFSPSSQTILIKFLLKTHQNPFVLMAMEDRQVSTKVNGTRERSGRVLNGAPQFVGRPEWELQWRQMSAGVVAE
jgi:hypothetical protein